MGVDHLIWGSDFPHQESEYPHSHDVIEQNFGRVGEEDRVKMLCANAARFFRLD
jgi:predicted TIM-barrel fold metal-dependent hydrolase